MKLYLTGLIIIGAIFVQAREIYMAPDGNDANTGTLEKPLASLHKAQELALQFRDKKFCEFQFPHAQGGRQSSRYRLPGAITQFRLGKIWIHIFQSISSR